MALQPPRCGFTGCMAMPSWAVLGVPQRSLPSLVHAVHWRWPAVLSTEVGSGMAIRMEEIHELLLAKLCPCLSLSPLHQGVTSVPGRSQLLGALS